MVLKPRPQPNGVFGGSSGSGLGPRALRADLLWLLPQPARAGDEWKLCALDQQLFFLSFLYR